MANALKKIFGSLRSNRSVLGVDISSSSIKVVQIRKENGAAVLETYGELALGPYTGGDRGQATVLPVEKMTGALKDLLKEANVTTKNAGVAIPMSSSLINVIKMPALSQKKLQSVVPIEMRKYIPVPIGEVLIDWREIPTKAQDHDAQEDTEEDEDGKNKKPLGKTEVFVIAIHKETIENFTNIIKNAGLSQSFFEVEIFSTIRTIATNPGESVMIIDFGAGTTKVYVVESGIIRDSHVINRGSQNITVSLSKALGISMVQAEKIKRGQGILKDDESSYQVSSLVVRGIFSEANRVLLNYQKKHNKNVSKIILTGGGSILKGIIDIANEDLVADTIISDPFSNLQYPAFLEKTLRLAGPEFAVAIGVALRKLDEIG
jgi:type IV pilus assembly protein PilM